MKAAVESSSLPTDFERKFARAASRDLATVITSQAETRRFEFRDDTGEVHSVELSASTLKIIGALLSEVGQGNAVSVIPIRAELTMREAAILLNVSQPCLTGLLERGEISFRGLNTHGRVLYQDVP
ncbi:DNA-binding protein [Robbsia sp. Bb-Pol-6]|uniref:DNA-binding protein n=1 Tax=Robbsia betulipollinis TaxID=2981849 RepID=A0ABT3ZRD4_9BURK|nr:DNA-binding protein [Robbsia betulipollinis]MCY0389119.1 DNA-binding protein [Robbsia betulipollinis]